MAHAISLFATHHQDLLWKWPSSTYVAIHERQFLRWMELFRTTKDFVAVVEQAETLRIYLAQHPEDFSLVREMIAEKRLILTGGAAIPDVNLVSGETIVRVLQMGRLFFSKTFGVIPEIDNRTDIFGMCSQLPQVLAKCGYKYVRPGRTPNLPKSLQNCRAYRWVAPDGSSVIVVRAETIPAKDLTSARPLCKTLDEGMLDDLIQARQDARARDVLLRFTSATGVVPQALFDCLDIVNRKNSIKSDQYVSPCVEWRSPLVFFQAMAKRELPEYSGEMNPLYTGCYSLRIDYKLWFRQFENMLFEAEMLYVYVNRHFANKGLQEKASDILAMLWFEMIYLSFHDSICGCVHDAADRELSKRQEFANSCIESLLHIMAPTLPKLSILNPSLFWGDRIVEWPLNTNTPQGMTSQRDAYRCFVLMRLEPMCINELMVAKNPNGAECRGRHDVDAVSKRDSDEGSVRTCFAGPLTINYSKPEPAIFITKDNIPVSRPDSCFGEVIFRHDSGTMWTEGFWGGWRGRDQTHVRTLNVQDGPLYFFFESEGHALFVPDETDGTGRNGLNLPKNIGPIAGDGSAFPFWDGFGKLKWRSQWRFFKNDGHFSLKLSIDWEGSSTKIAIRFPFNFPPSKSYALYSVPFGSIRREPYFEVSRTNQMTLSRLRDKDDYTNAKGDWPTGPWIDCRGPRFSVAVGNSGTPGQQYVNGDLIVSLMRSPTAVNNGGMRPQKGVLGCGHHEYEFSFFVHDNNNLDAVCYASDLVNRKPHVLFGNTASRRDCVRGNQTKARDLSVRDFLTPKTLVVSSFRPTDDPAKAVLRVYEPFGMETNAILNESVFTLVEEGDLCESEWTPCTNNVRFHPYEIKTLRVSFS